jgi:hypothetical protein
MTNNTNQLEYLVLQAVANDFEDFETIVSEIGKWTTGGEPGPDASQIEHALMMAIADENAKAYQTREGHGQLVATKADPQNIHRSGSTSRTKA